jgi:exopolysaccharide biosynthesis polyprenyl glycosylphosphotransferase
MDREADTKQQQPSRAAGNSLRRRRRQSTPSGSYAHRIAVATGAGISPLWESGADRKSMPEAAIRSRRDMVLRRTLGLTDVVSAYFALWFVVHIVAGNRPVQLRPSDVLIAPFVVLAAKAIGLYDRDQHVLRKTTLDELPALLYLSVLYTLMLWLCEALLFHGWLGRPQVFALAVTTFALLTLGRALARAVTAVRTSAERCVIVGNSADAVRIAKKLANSPGVKATVVGRVSLHADDESEAGNARASGSLSSPGSLARVIEANDIERVILAPDGHDQDEILHVIRLIKALGVKVSVLPRLLEVVGSSSTFEDVDGMTLLGVRQYGVSKSSASLKRLMDVGGAAIGLCVLGPLLLFLALAIKLDSRGPVFFRQRRIGRSGELFSMVKCRSMVRDAEDNKNALRERNEVEGGLFKIADDPRITRVGRFLRRTSLDELPQLLNVLGGSMSLVGPRPLVPDEDVLIEGWQRRRLAVKPGMTGMWQIFGSSRIPMQEMVKIDYLYGANWSIWLDLKILLRTVPYVLRRRGL